MGTNTVIVVNLPEALWPFLEDELPQHIRPRFESRPHGRGAIRRGQFIPEEARLVRMAVLRTERHLLKRYGRSEMELAHRCAGLADRIEADLSVAGVPA